MRTLASVVFFLASLLLASYSSANCSEPLNFESKRLHSSEVIQFCERFQGKTLLVVNTASQCGFTGQFRELEELYQRYKDNGLEIIGFPSNDFRQEHSAEEKTAEVCYKNFGVRFTMLSPSKITGPEKNAFFTYLEKASGKQPNWNFNKYLIADDLSSVQYYSSTINPLNSALERDIQKLLKMP